MSMGFLVHSNRMLGFRVALVFIGYDWLFYGVSSGFWMGSESLERLHDFLRAPDRCRAYTNFYGAGFILGSLVLGLELSLVPGLGHLKGP